MLEYQTYILYLDFKHTYIHTLSRHLNWVFDIEDLRRSLFSKPPVQSFKIMHYHNQIFRGDSMTHWSLLQLLCSFLLDICHYQTNTTCSTYVRHCHYTNSTISYFYVALWQLVLSKNIVKFVSVINLTDLMGT